MAEGGGNESMDRAGLRRTSRSGGSPSIRNAGGFEKSAAGADLSVGVPNWLNGWPPVTSVRGTQGIFHFSGWWGPWGTVCRLGCGSPLVFAIFF